MKKYPSILNDVIGPVMRGPSSSHTAASWRIASLSRQILGEPIISALVEFDINGAWANNYREQGTVLGINGGLLELDITDDRMKHTELVSNEKNVSITYKVSTFENYHVNSVQLTLKSKLNKVVKILAASLGGGSFEIQSINGSKVNIHGDKFELILTQPKKKYELEEVRKLFIDENIYQQGEFSNDLVNIKSSVIYSGDILNKIKEMEYFSEIIVLNPILPVVSKNKKEIPFETPDELLDYSLREEKDLGELGLLYESAWSGLSQNELKNKMKSIINTIFSSIEIGLAGTYYKDRILQQQSNLISKSEANQQIFQNRLLNNTISYVSAIMESKSAMEVIVANPTAGSCGTVGGVLKSASEELNSSIDEIIMAFYAAGMIGVFFAMGPGFSAEEHGCQVECGAAAGMAAAGIVQLFKGSTKQSISAASMSIQNMIGLVCDPVGDRVEVPCLGKNISAAMNSLSSATMALSGYDPVIPLNEVIETVESVSKQMPSCVKCTGCGGLAITPTSITIKENLKNLE